MKKNDIILIIVILVVAALGFSWIQMQKQEEAGTVKVYVDGEEKASYQLNQDGEYDIETESGTNRLVIKDGEADVTYADCPDELCVKQASISKNGETIVCLPHKVVVEIVSTDESELDALVK